MALTKKEQAEFKQLREERDLARALSWPTFPKPLPLPPAKEGEVIAGWSINVFAARVEQQWCRANTNYTSDPRKDKTHGWQSGGSQEQVTLYATEAEAYQALFHELAEKYAVELDKVLKRAFPCPE